MELNEILKGVKGAGRALARTADSLISQNLLDLADELELKSAEIISANAKDLEKIEPGNPIWDRILLDSKRISDIATGVREIAGYGSPIGIVLEERKLKSGIDLKKVSVPLGVVGVIFEARPNVVVDIFALCFKSKNVCVLKGGSDSESSNEILVKIIKSVLGEGQEGGKSYTDDSDLSDGVVLLPNDREVVAEFLKARKYIDVIIPRGSQSLIEFVRENAKVLVIETGAGVVHIYFDKSGDREKGRKIIFNAKTTRPSVCNSLDTLIVERSRLAELPHLFEEMASGGVEVLADREAFAALDGFYPEELLKLANSEDFGREFLSLKMAVKTVGGLDEALDHIAQFSSQHSEAIITEDMESAERFLKEVDSATVYHNASTRFTDGGEFGLGAEVGISTQKLHARGPMGIRELTTYKWILRGHGEVR